MKMTKLLFALLLFSSPVMAEEPVEEVRWPTYCIRSVEQNDDGTYLLDMPGWPYMDDSPFLVTTLEHLDDVPNCTPDDPRMQ